MVCGFWEPAGWDLGGQVVAGRLWLDWSVYDNSVARGFPRKVEKVVAWDFPRNVENVPVAMTPLGTYQRPIVSSRHCPRSINIIAYRT